MSQIPAIQAYLVEDLLPRLLRPVETSVTVVRGHPGIGIDRALVALGPVTADVAKPCYGPGRPRQESITQTILVSVGIRGGVEAEAECDQVAWALAGAIQDHFTTNDNQRLGGLATEAAITSYTADRDNDPDLLAKGRNTLITLTLTVRATTTT